MIPFMNSMYKSHDKNQNYSCETHLPRMGYGLHVSQHKTPGKTGMDMDFESLRRDHQFQKAKVMLQCQLQEVKERQRRAQLHNQKLLHDFQKAQNTLSDVVALMEAMNFIRVEYERSLEETFSKWHQKVHGKRLSDQCKRIEQRPKRTNIKHDDQNMDGVKNPPVGINSPSSMFTDTCDRPVSYCCPQTYDHIRKGHIQVTRSILSCPDTRQVTEGNIPNDMRPCCPFNLLSSQSCPPVNELQKSSTSNKNKNVQDIHPVWTSSLLPPYQLSGELLHSAYSVIQQESSHCDGLWKYPNSRGTQNSRFSNGRQCASDDAPWLGLSVDEDSSGHDGRTSGGNVQRRRNGRNGTINIKNPFKGKEPVLDMSSPVSDQSVSIKMVAHRKSYSRQTSTESKENVRRVTAGDSPEEQHEQENNQVEQIITSNEWTPEAKGGNTCKKTEEAEEMYTGEEEEEESLDDEKHTEEKKSYMAENCEETKYDQEEVQKLLRHNSQFVQLNSLREKEEEEEEEEVEDDEEEEVVKDEEGEGKEVEEEGEVDKREIRDKTDAQGQISKGVEQGSEQELNKSESSASCLERNIHDSLKELYKNDTEDEELSSQEADDDKDYGDDDNDDVMVGKASPRTYNPGDNDNIYQEDEDDEVEEVLAPQNNLLERQVDEAEEEDTSKDLGTDTEEEQSNKKTVLAPVKEMSEDSDDEFDHFYD